MMISTTKLKGCDTFVALPPCTANGCVVFGKNSDRHANEVQEIIYMPAATYDDGAKLQCTYIEVDQARETHSVILSAPAWMWGAEMGANEYGVVAGNEAVWNKLSDADSDKEEKLLGMDLLRLGLERSKTAKECVLVITSLLELYGQGGPCSEQDPDFTYHNSFLICDGTEAWVLETAGTCWAAENVTTGVRNISNVLTITTKIDMMSDGLKETAVKNGFWNDGDGDFNFKLAFSNDATSSRLEEGKRLLEQFSAQGDMKEMQMFQVLRDKESGICMSGGGVVSASSQVSVIAPPDHKRPACHWFTGTVDPSKSVFKPFIFCPSVRISPACISPTYSDDQDPAKVKPRFQKSVDRKHKMYAMHEKAHQTFSETRKQELLETLKELEIQCVDEVENFLSSVDKNNNEKMAEMAEIFKDAVETEIKFYK